MRYSDLDQIRFKQEEARARGALAPGGALKKHQSNTARILGRSALIDSTRTPPPVRFLASLGEETI